MAGAVLQLSSAAGLAAQQPTAAPPRPAPTDTVRRPATPDSVRAALPGADTTRRAAIDSVRGIPDTLKKVVRRDSIQAPLARAEVPVAVGVGPIYRWTRDSVFTTGAINLTDLLARVPGLTIFRSGFIASAQTAAYNGRFTHVRVFRDGVELDVLDPRARGVQDLGDVQLANIDEIAVERAASEIRVHLRSWTVRNTTAYTRVDAFTGDEDTNLYRFFYGKRFGNGLDAQVGVQQFGTGARNRRVGGGGNVLDALARIGWSRGRWSADLTYDILRRQRDQTNTFVDQDSVLPPFDARRGEASLRLAFGDPDGRGPWFQAIANTAGLRVSGTSVPRVDSTFSFVSSSAAGARVTQVITQDSVATRDSSAARTQYVLTGGFTRGAIRLSATDRLRAANGETFNTPSVRASYDSRLLQLSAFGEWNAPGGYEPTSALALSRIPARRLVLDTIGKGTADVRVDTTARDTTILRARTIGLTVPPRRTTRLDLSARLSPLSWLAFVASVSRDQSRYSSAFVAGDTADDTLDSAVTFPVVEAPAVTTARLEAAVRVGRMWLTGGIVRRDADTLVAPAVFERVQAASGFATLAGYASPSVSGTVFGARGLVWKDVYLDATGTVWQRSDVYLPQYQVRGEVGVVTNWLRRFPSGNFGFKAAVIDEYRSRTPFWLGAATGGDLCEVGACALANNVLTAQLEIRIQSGTLSYQLRNALNRQYELVPGLRMPGPISYYGLRWTFWN